MKPVTNEQVFLDKLIDNFHFLMFINDKFSLTSFALPTSSFIWWRERIVNREGLFLITLKNIITPKTLKDITTHFSESCVRKQ